MGVILIYYIRRGFTCSRLDKTAQKMCQLKKNTSNINLRIV